MLRPTGGEHFQGDLVMEAGDLALDDGLNTAVLVSLFSDRRAEPHDELPDHGESRRGWWGDGLNNDNDRLGSRLWLLVRRKQTPETRQLFEDFTREALAWLVADSLAAKVDVSAAWAARGVLVVAIVIHRPTGEAEKFEFTWNAQAARMEYLNEVII
jgi:phage gp46-like protein